MFDFSRDTFACLTFTGENGVPLRAPNAKRVAFYYACTYDPGLCCVPADGSQR